MLNFDFYEKVNIEDFLESLAFYNFSDMEVSVEHVNGRYKVTAIVDTFDDWGYPDTDEFVVHVDTPEEVQYIKNHIK